MGNKISSILTNVGDALVLVRKCAYTFEAESWNTRYLALIPPGNIINGSCKSGGYMVTI